MILVDQDLALCSFLDRYEHQIVLHTKGVLLQHQDIFVFIITQGKVRYVELRQNSEYAL